MARNEVKITLTGDANDVVKEYQKLNKAQADVEKGIEKTRQTSREAAAENRRLGRVAQQTLKDVSTDAENAAREMDDLNKAFKAGKLDVVTYDRAVDQLEQRMGKAAPMGQRMAGAVTEMKNSLVGGAGLASSFASGLQAIGPAGAAAVAAIGAVVAAAKRGIAEARAFDRTEASTAAQIDRVTSRVLRQANRGADQRGATTNRFLEIADTMRYDPLKTAQVVEAGISTGLGDVDRNGVAESLIGGITAMNLEEADPVQVVETVAALLKNFGKKATKGNVRDVMQRIHGTFGEGVVQLSHMNRLVENASMLSLMGESFGSSLGLQASFQEVASPDKVRTAMQNYMKAVEVDIPTQKGKREAIEAVGLTSDSLKLGNQSFAQSLSTLSGAMNRAGYGVDEQAQLIGSVFGGENASTVVAMMGQVSSGDYERRIAMQRDTGAYKAAQDRFREDLMAGQTQQTVSRIRTEIRDAAAATRNTMVTDEIALQKQRIYQDMGDSITGTTAAWTAGAALSAMDYIGLGDNMLSLNDAVSGRGTMARIERSVRSRDPNALPYTAPGAAESMANALPLGTWIPGFAELARSLDQLTETNRQMLNQSSSQPGAGTTATEAPTNTAAIVREDTPLPIGGVGSAYGATP